MVRNLCSIAILFVALGVSGCGDDGPVRALVSGTVTLDGKPLEDGIIYFKRPEEGAIDRMEIKDGNFEGMVELGDRRVEVCQYRFGTPFKMGGGELPNRINTIDARFNTLSEITASVNEDGPNEFSFDVASKRISPAVRRNLTAEDTTAPLEDAPMTFPTLPTGRSK